METLYESDFNKNYQTHLKHLRIKDSNQKQLRPIRAPFDGPAIISITR